MDVPLIYARKNKAVTTSEYISDYLGWSHQLVIDQIEILLEENPQYVKFFRKIFSRDKTEQYEIMQGGFFLLALVLAKPGDQGRSGDYLLAFTSMEESLMLVRGGRGKQEVGVTAPSIVVVSDDETKPLYELLSIEGERFELVERAIKMLKLTGEELEKITPPKMLRQQLSLLRERCWQRLEWIQKANRIPGGGNLTGSVPA